VVRGSQEGFDPEQGRRGSNEGGRVSTFDIEAEGGRVSTFDIVKSDPTTVLITSRDEEKLIFL
jgi:hypothetical protein